VKAYLLIYEVAKKYEGNSHRFDIFNSYEEAYEYGKEELLRDITREYNESRIAQNEYKDDMAGFVRDHINYRFEIEAYKLQSESSENYFFNVKNVKEEDEGSKDKRCFFCGAILGQEEHRFIRDDTCDRITWDFDAFGNLTMRLYWHGAGYTYLPYDEADDAGTKFNVGDFVLIDKDGESYSSATSSTLYVIFHTAGKKGIDDGRCINMWENIYYLVDNDGFAGHEHVHESQIKLFSGEPAKDSPLWFWRDYALDKIDDTVIVNVEGEKMTLEEAINDSRISFHEGISWREVLKKKKVKIIRK